MRLRPLAALFTTSFAALTTLAAPALADPSAEARERAASAIGRGDYALAEKELASVKGGAEHAEAVLDLAGLELKTGRYADAIATAKAAARLGPAARDEAAAIRGKALAAQGKTAEAIAALKEVEGDDGARRARVYLGEMLDPRRAPRGREGPAHAR